MKGTAVIQLKALALGGCAAHFYILYQLEIKGDTCYVDAWSCYFESGEAESKIVGEVVRK